MEDLEIVGLYWRGTSWQSPKASANTAPSVEESP